MSEPLSPNGSTDAAAIRQSVIALLGFASVEEELLLAAVAGRSDPGSPENWAALPIVAHNSEFKRQQVARLEAIGQPIDPPEFAEVDHLSAETYRAASARTAAEVLADARSATAALIDQIREVEDVDLLDPARHAWLRGRHLWLQVVVRGFWHPTGHLGDYYLSHGQGDRAVSLHQAAVDFARYAAAPAPARGMAAYNLACAQARIGLHDSARSNLDQAALLNTDLRAKAAADPDLAPLREIGVSEAAAPR